MERREIFEPFKSGFNSVSSLTIVKHVLKIIGENATEITSQVLGIGRNRLML